MVIHQRRIACSLSMAKHAEENVLLLGFGWTREWQRRVLGGTDVHPGFAPQLEFLAGCQSGNCDLICEFGIQKSPRSNLEASSTVVKQSHSSLHENQMPPNDTHGFNMSFQKASLRSSALGVRSVLIDDQAYQLANINRHDPRALFLKYRDQDEEVRRRRKLPQTSSLQLPVRRGAIDNRT